MNLKPSRKKVLFITPQPYISDRGSPLRVKSEVEALVSLGYDVDLLCFPFGKDHESEKIKIYRCSKIPLISEPTVGPSLQKILYDIPLTIKGFLMGIKSRYDVIHGVEEAAFIASSIAFIKRTPYIVDMHSLLPDQLQYSGFMSSKLALKSSYGLYNRCLKKSSGIVAVCKDVYDYAKLHAPKIPCAQLEDLPLDSAFENNTDYMDEISDRFNLKDKTVLTYTGNFNPYQGIPLLLESFSILLKKNSHVKDLILLLVGENNSERVDSVKKIANSLGISNNIVFTGELPASYMGSVMSLSRVLISPRINGSNTPLKIYCYMASGKPVVATNISSHLQALDENSAFLTPPDPIEFANTIENAIDDSADSINIQNKKINNAKLILDTRFNKRVFTSRMGWLYERVTQAPTPSSDWEKSLNFKAAI